MQEDFSNYKVNKQRKKENGSSTGQKKFNIKCRNCAICIR